MVDTLYTVIIINTKTSEHLKSCRFLFEPFIARDEVAFCDWNEGGTDIQSSVPDLYALIRGKKKWRALILNTDSILGYKGCILPKSQNPFDYSAHDSRMEIHESSVPLIRLTQMLGGVPRGEPRYEKGYEYFDEEIGEIKRIRESEITESELEDLDSRCDVKAVYIEVTLSSEEKTRYQELSEKYILEGARPQEILLVATHAMNVENDRAKYTAAWKDFFEYSSSSFWEKNRYPNICRFLFTDISKSDHPQYEQDISNFALSILTLALNKIDASTLQAYRLYKMNIDTNSEILGEFLNAHLNSLKSAYQFVNDKLESTQVFEFDGGIVDVYEHIPFSTEKTDDMEDKVDLDASNKSVDGFGNYNRKLQTAESNLSSQMKDPRRAIDRAARLVRNKMSEYYGKSHELDEFQIEDLKKELDKYELDAFSTRPKNAYSAEKVELVAQKAKEQTERFYAEPMTTEQLIGAGFIALIFIVLGNILYFADAYDQETLTASVILTIVMTAVTAMGGVWAIKTHEAKMISKIEESTKVARDEANVIQQSNAVFEDYFTNICSYMKGLAILDGTAICDDRETSLRNRLGNHLKALKAAIERDEKWLFNYDIKQAEYTRDYNIGNVFNCNVPPAENEFYKFDSATGENMNIPINQTGDQCISPYSFVSYLSIEREELFDEDEV